MRETVVRDTRALSLVNVLWDLFFVSGECVHNAQPKHILRNKLYLNSKYNVIDDVFIS